MLRQSYLLWLCQEDRQWTFLDPSLCIVKNIFSSPEDIQKIPAERGVTNSWLCHHLLKAEQYSSTPISKFEKLFPLKSWKIGRKLKIRAMKRVVRTKKKGRDSILSSDEFLCPECLLIRRIKNFQFLLQNQMLTILLIVCVLLYGEEKYDG